MIAQASIRLRHLTQRPPLLFDDSLRPLMRLKVVNEEQATLHKANRDQVRRLQLAQHNIQEHIKSLQADRKTIQVSTLRLYEKSSRDDQSCIVKELIEQAMKLDESPRNADTFMVHMHAARALNILNTVNELANQTDKIKSAVTQLQSMTF